MGGQKPMTEDIDTKIYRAVLDFASDRYSGLARQMVNRLQRIHASGNFEEHRHKTLWDEYCHEVQNGPHDCLEHAWQLTLIEIADHIIDRIPIPEAALLTIAADDFEFGAGHIGGNHDTIRHRLLRAVGALAGQRSLERFDPSA